MVTENFNHAQSYCLYARAPLEYTTTLFTNHIIGKHLTHVESFKSRFCIEFGRNSIEDVEQKKILFFFAHRIGRLAILIFDCAFYTILDMRF